MSSPLVRRLGTALALACLAGVATSYLQTVLPDALASLANSAGTWCALAFVLAWGGRSEGEGVLTAVLGLLGLVVGYYVAADLRGFGVSMTSVGFWCVAALSVGPLLGLAAVWVRRGTGWRGWLGVPVLPGLLVAEGAWALVHVADTTSPAYWTGEILAGLVLVGALVARRVRLRA